MSESCAVATSHQGRSEPGPGLPTGHPEANKDKILGFEQRSATLRIPIEGIAAVHHDIPCRKQGSETGDHLVHRLSGLDHHQDTGRLFQRGDKGFKAIIQLDACTQFLTCTV